MASPTSSTRTVKSLTGQEEPMDTLAILCELEKYKHRLTMVTHAAMAVSLEGVREFIASLGEELECYEETCGIVRAEEN